jgi:RNase P/RNase MRP subunit POP5
MKSLKPSHKEKKRYLLLKGKDIDEKSIDSAILKFIGVLGYAKASPRIIKKSKQQTILSINRRELDKIRASFLLSKKDIRIEKVSGTINNLK